MGRKKKDAYVVRTSPDEISHFCCILPDSICIRIVVTSRQRWWAFRRCTKSRCLLFLGRSIWNDVSCNVFGSSDGNLWFLQTCFSSITVDGFGRQVAGLTFGVDAINQLLRLVVCRDVSAFTLSKNKEFSESGETYDINTHNWQPKLGFTTLLDDRLCEMAKGEKRLDGGILEQLGGGEQDCVSK